MKRAIIATVLAPVLFGTGAAGAQPAVPKAGERVEIMLSGPTRIRAFAPGIEGKGIYLQDSRRNWFYGSFFKPCHSLIFARDVRFSTFAGGNTLSSADSVWFPNVIPGEACEIIDLARAGPPPTKPRRSFLPRRSFQSREAFPRRRY